MKKITTLIVLAVILFGSCQKEIQPNGVDVSKLAIVAKDNLTTIPYVLITNWFAKNPVAASLTIDWTKAQQAVIGGVDVVKVPVFAVKNPTVQQSNIKTQSLKNLSDNVGISGFNPAHPPALYFFKVPGSADSVRAVLLNFVPDDPNKENGEHKIWTGKLIEWNMQSEAGHYQQLTKSKVTTKGTFYYGQAAPNSLSTKVKINSFWDWLGDAFTSIYNAVVSVINAIGTFLNVPGDYGSGSTGSWCYFLWGGWCNDGSTNNGGGGGGGNYDSVYGNYLDGYNGNNGDAWVPYAGGPSAQTPPTVSVQQVTTRIVVTDIITNLGTQYQVDFGFTDKDMQDIADFIFNEDSNNIALNIDQLNNYTSNSDDDPPIIAQFKAMIRYFLGIDNPKTAEEAQQYADDRGRMGFVGQKIIQLHQAYVNTLGFIPGYVAFDDMMQGDGAGFAANFAFDIFGGELLKFVSGPILRVGSKYVVRASEMVGKYPNIVNYFKTIGVHELTVIKGAAANKVIVIGENMDKRVTPSISTFNKIFNSGIEPFEGTPFAVQDFANNKALYGTMTDAQLKATLLYQQNVTWINQAIQDGYTIIDIGIDQSNPVRSVFYSMERSFIYK